MSDDYLARLQSLVPPPPAPIDVDDATLQANLKSLKTNFPSDYLQYAKVYGSGRIRVGPYTWEIWSPARPSYPLTVKKFYDIWSQLRNAAGTHDLRLGLYPETEGLLPFGVRSDVWFTWKTEGPPDTWKVVVMWSYEHDSYQKFDMNLSEFLYKLLTREIRVAGFVNEWNARDVTFKQKVFAG